MCLTHSCSTKFLWIFHPEVKCLTDLHCEKTQKQNIQEMNQIWLSFTIIIIAETKKTFISGILTGQILIVLTLTKKYFPELDLHCVSCRILLIVFFQCAVVEWLNCVLCERGCRVMISCSLSGLFRVQLEHKISKFVYNYCLLCDWLRMKLLYRIREPLGTQSPFPGTILPENFFFSKFGLSIKSWKLGPPTFPPPPPDMGILDFSKFELSIKSWKLVSTNTHPPSTWEFWVLANLNSASKVGNWFHQPPPPPPHRTWEFWVLANLNSDWTELTKLNCY